MHQPLNSQSGSSSSRLLLKLPLLLLPVCVWYGICENSRSNLLLLHPLQLVLELLQVLLQQLHELLIRLPVHLQERRLCMQSSAVLSNLLLHSP